ncbi:MAG TPA: polysaccharide biosynthesis/export family protein [Sphingobacteriaceae bacterium]
MKNRLSFYLLVGFVLSSCSSYKEVPYFQDLDRQTSWKESIQNYAAATIQSEDILGINVASLNPEASSVFNYSLNPVAGVSYNNTDNPVMGYLVDPDGKIYLPLLGEVKAAGSTTAQLREDIRKKLLNYLRDPVVNIRMLNFKVSVMGDVLNPGVYKIHNEKVTITEVLSMAGDLNITAKRTNVLLIREQNGSREYIPIDLTSKEIFQSPYYYLRSNDVIYVQPDKTKYDSVDRTYRSAGLILSALSIVAIVLTRN